MRRAAARAAMRRGSSSRTRPLITPASMSAGATRMVLPAPVGARSTRFGARFKAAMTSGRTSSMGSRFNRPEILRTGSARKGLLHGYEERRYWISMQPSNSVAGLLLIVTVTAAACSSTAKPAPSPPADGHRTIAEGYSLLYALASQQKDSDKLLIIKPESDQVDALINELSTYMAELCAELEDFSKRYPALTIETQFLPEVEVKVRESITSESTTVLLGTSGKEF